MDGPTRFRPTWTQAVGTGLALGLVAGGVLDVVVAVVGAVSALLRRPGLPSGAAWLLLTVLPPVLGAALGAALGRWHAVDVDAHGIRLQPNGEREPWARVVDLRAERRNNRTVVAVYLDGGVAVQLRAPYDGGLLAADPQFEQKLFLLSAVWRSHRIGRSTG